MSNSTFAVSDIKYEFCYEPQVCPTRNGHLVVWAFGVDTDESLLMVRAYEGNVALPTVSIGKISEGSHLTLLEPSQNDYLLAVETPKYTKLYFLSERGELLREATFKSKVILLKHHPFEDGYIIFTHQINEDTLTVSKIPTDWSLDDYQVLSIYTGVYGIPQVFICGDRYVAGWIKRDESLEVVNNTFEGDDGSAIILEDYTVDYLVACEFDHNLLAFGGIDGDTLRFDLFTKGGGSHIDSIYWTSDLYKGKEISLWGTNRGCLLLADGQDSTNIIGQRFTHLGGYLYPPREMVDFQEHSWSPVLSYHPKGSLVVFIRDFGDYNQVWAKKLPLDTVPELEDLCYP